MKDMKDMKDMKRYGMISLAALCLTILFSGCGAGSMEANWDDMGTDHAEAATESSTGSTGSIAGTMERSMATTGSIAGTMERSVATTGSAAYMPGESRILSDGAVRQSVRKTGKQIYAGKISSVDVTLTGGRNQNSTNIYGSDGERYTIYQMKLDGTELKELRLAKRKSDSIMLYYVDDEYIYYSRDYYRAERIADDDGEGFYDDGRSEQELWRAPIKKTNGTDEVLFKKEEKLFSKHELRGILVKDGLIYVNAIEDFSDWTWTAPNQTASLYDTHRGRFIDLDADEAFMKMSRWDGVTKDGGILRVAKLGELTVNILYLVDAKTDEMKELMRGDGWYSPGAICNEKAAFFAKEQEIQIFHDGIVERYLSKKDIEVTIDPVLEELREKGRIKENQAVDWEIRTELDLIKSGSRLKIDVAVMDSGVDPGKENTFIKDVTLSCALTEHPEASLKIIKK